MFFEVPIYWSNGELVVHSDRGSLGEGYADLGDLIQDIGDGDASLVVEVEESDLPAPFVNNLYPRLKIYSIANMDNFVGICEL